MFGWFASGPPKFDQSTISNQVTLSKEGCRAFHSNEEDLGGVLFLYPQLNFVDNLAYFEVKIEVTRDDEEDGLTLGVTTVFPSFASEQEKPGCADDVEMSWSLGYDGRAHINGASDLLPTSWNPKHLKRGDIVGFLVSADGAACVLVNQEIVITMPGIIPVDQPLYGMLDLLGNCQGVLLNESATPPAAHKGFSLQKVRDDVVEEIYNYVAEQNYVQVKAAMTLAKQLGVPESLLKAAEKSMQNGPRKSAVRKSKMHAGSSGRSRSSVAAVSRTESSSSPVNASGQKGARASTAPLNPRASSANPTGHGAGEDPPSPRPRSSKIHHPPKKASVLKANASSSKADAVEKKGDNGKENEVANAQKAEQEKKEAERKAEEARIKKAEEERAKQSAEEIAKKKAELVQGLDEALKSDDMDKIKEAISNAKEGGLDAADVKRGEVGLRKLEVVADLNAAVRTNKIDEIKAAISKAKDADVSASVIEKAEKAIADIQRRIDEAKAKLKKEIEKAKSVKPPTVEMMAALDDATKEAAAAGVDVSEAQAVHKQMIEDLAAAKREAEDDLRAAIPGKSADAIGKAVKKCKLFGSDKVVAEALDKLSELISEDILSIKDAEKSVRTEKLPTIEALVGLLRESMHPKGKKLHNDVQDIKGALRVFCRVRPLNKRELAMNDTIVVEMADQFTVSVAKDPKKTGDSIECFSYDSIFVATQTQEDVFEECKGLIESCFDGYNVTIFTYGQTGAGKTWTLYGIPEQPGVSPRTCESVFEVAENLKEKLDIQVSASMIELYNSNVRDLLANEKPPPKLEIKNEKMKDGSIGVRLDSVTVDCTSVADLTKAVEKGFGNRKVTATAMNADSSRSHLMFMIFVKVKEKAESGRERSGKITIVDLAGSERLAKSQVTGDAQKEAIEINKSLTALGDVMMAVSKKEKMIPYRNHKLTQLMQDSLGGTAKTLMFVNISPASNNADETICALKYASRARAIENDTSGGDGAKKKSVPKAKSGGSRSK
mmetsp:Transcript_68544/g.108050  ORF Transcript_68544/g.108050 Transcript_68544/m.108050 type:complete len:1004 (-) Transcript_68544:36-3047(-)